MERSGQEADEARRAAGTTGGEPALWWRWSREILAGVWDEGDVPRGGLPRTTGLPVLALAPAAHEAALL